MDEDREHRGAVPTPQIGGEYRCLKRLQEILPKPLCGPRISLHGFKRPQAVCPHLSFKSAASREGTQQRWELPRTIHQLVKRNSCAGPRAGEGGSVCSHGAVRARADAVQLLRSPRCLCVCVLHVLNCSCWVATQARRLPGLRPASPPRREHQDPHSPPFLFSLAGQRGLRGVRCHQGSHDREGNVLPSRA